MPRPAPFHPAAADAARLYDLVDSPIGELLVTSDGSSLTSLRMMPDDAAPDITQGWERDAAALSAVTGQLARYFAGELTQFDLPLAPSGTDFQMRVWAALRDIPYGETASYGELAAAIGKPTASRAVGAANGRNPIAVIVPCHRVIGASGALVGFGGGLDRKRTLLDIERGAEGVR